LANQIYSSFKNEYPSKLYHGDKNELIDGVPMGKITEHDFKNINEALKNIQLCIYTGVMTAGVDIQKRFD